ncbi:hypothetical protein PYCC9005_004584 [Savitreella phatthalungensis]
MDPPLQTPTQKIKADMNVSESPSSTPTSKNYQCSVCFESFKRHEHLIRHARRHTLEKPFKCQTCGKEFARRDILSRHAIVHVPAAERANMPQKTNKRGTKRVQQACNNCARGKCRCDGATPCSTCLTRGLDCEYTIPVPAKRKRADSSASQAAANALLQVANSAGASPKQEWALDPSLQYTTTSTANATSTATAGNVPTYSAYQPALPELPSYAGGSTFGGSVAGALFQPGLSRPGSAYVSRAASPTHDYDAPFESVAATGTSMFAFLFNDPRNLPAINAILPSLFATHGTQEPANGYSNYRGSAIQNGLDSPSLGPSSVSIPSAFDFTEDEIISWSSGLDSIPELSISDRSRLQEYLQATLPSLPLLNLLVKLYFTRFHVNFPMLHKPTYNPQETHCMLIMVILTVGARYIEAAGRAEELYRTLYTISREGLKNESGDSFFMLQAQLLLDLSALTSAYSQSQLDDVEERRATFIKRARHRGQFAENYDEAPKSDMDTEGRWQVLRRAEERRRLTWAIFTYDFLFALFFGTKPLIEIDEVRVSLPCDESLWDAGSAKEWASVFAPDRIPLRTRNLYGIGRLEEKPETAKDLGCWCRTVLAMVEARRVHDFRVMIPARLPTESQTQLDVRLSAENVSGDVQRMSSKAFSVLAEALQEDDHSESSQAIQNHGLLTFFELSTNMDFAILRKFALGDERACLSWAKMHAHDSNIKVALLCASRTVSLLKQTDVRGMINGFMTLFTVLTLAFAARYLDVWRDEEIALENNEDDILEGWLHSGYQRPTAAEFGSLSVETAPHILDTGTRFARQNVLWGNARIAACLENMVRRYAPA